MKKIIDSEGIWAIDHDDYFHEIGPISKEQIASLICYFINSRTPLGNELEKSKALIKHMDSLHILTQYVEHKGKISRIHFINEKQLSVFCIDFPPVEIITDYLNIFFKKGYLKRDNGLIKMISGLPCDVNDKYSAPRVTLAKLLELMPQNHDSMFFHTTKQNALIQHSFIEPVETDLIFFSGQKAYSFNVERHIRQSLGTEGPKASETLIISINHKENSIVFSYSQDKNLYWHKYESSEWEGTVDILTLAVDVKCVHSQMYSSK